MPATSGFAVWSRAARHPPFSRRLRIHRLEPYRHTRKDTCDALKPEGLASCCRISVRALVKPDGGALDG